MLMMWFESFVVGLVLGGVFAFLKLPIPAPATIAGVIGILGVCIGAIMINYFLYG